MKKIGIFCVLIALLAMMAVPVLAGGPNYAGGYREGTVSNSQGSMEIAVSGERNGFHLEVTFEGSEDVFEFEWNPLTEQYEGTNNDDAIEFGGIGVEGQEVTYFADGENEAYTGHVAEIV